MCEGRIAGGGKGAEWCWKERRCGAFQTYEEQGAALNSTLQKAATLAKLSGLPEAELSEAVSLFQRQEVRRRLQIWEADSPLSHLLCYQWVQQTRLHVSHCSFLSCCIFILFSFSVQQQQGLSLREQNTESKNEGANQAWWKIQNRKGLKREL